MRLRPQANHLPTENIFSLINFHRVSRTCKLAKKVPRVIVAKGSYGSLERCTRCLLLNCVFFCIMEKFRVVDIIGQCLMERQTGGVWNERGTQASVDR